MKNSLFCFAFCVACFFSLTGCVEIGGPLNPEYAKAIGVNVQDVKQNDPTPIAVETNGSIISSSSAVLHQFNLLEPALVSITIDYPLNTPEKSIHFLFPNVTFAIYKDRIQPSTNSTEVKFESLKMPKFVNFSDKNTFAIFQSTTKTYFFINGVMVVSMDVNKMKRKDGYYSISASGRRGVREKVLFSNFISESGIQAINTYNALAEQNNKLVAKERARQKKAEEEQMRAMAGFVGAVFGAIFAPVEGAKEETNSFGFINLRGDFVANFENKNLQNYASNKDCYSLGDRELISICEGYGNVPKQYDAFYNVNKGNDPCIYLSNVSNNVFFSCKRFFTDKGNTKPTKRQKGDWLVYVLNGIIPW